MTTESYMKCPVSYVKRKLKENIYSFWNEEWLSSMNGSITKDLFFPTVYDRLKCKYISVNNIFAQTQILSGHGKFNACFGRFKIATPNGSLCNCGDDSSDGSFMNELALLNGTLIWTGNEPAHFLNERAVSSLYECKQHSAHRHSTFPLPRHSSRESEGARDKTLQLRRSN